MRHLIGDDANEMSGFGEVAEVHEGPDGNLYEWVEGLSAWGEPVGYWQGLSEVPVQPAPALGALYQASDGSLYQMHGLGEEEEEKEESAEEPPAEDGDGAGPAKKMGPGKPGEIRVGPDGKRYRWVMGLGPGGKRTGFWRRLRPRPRRPGPQVRRAAPGGARRPGARPAASGPRKKKPFLKRLLPLAKVAASFIPIPGAGQIVKGGLTLADKALSRKQVAGLGALYQAPDGSVYQVQGIDEEELHGFAESDAIDGFYSDADIDGLVRDEIEGIEEGSDIDGWGEPVAPPIEGDDALEGYIREPQRTTLQAYVPDKPPQTPAFDPTREPPDNWKPLW
jgi:hypothetical protein